MSALSAFLAQVFPQNCLLCLMPLTTNEKHCCNTCYDYLPFITMACAKCNTPLFTNEEVCGFCLSQQRYWDSCISPFAYTDPLPQLIQEFKYLNKTDKINFFTDCMIETAKNHGIEMPDFFTFTPSHPKRFIERGYNQSLRLAQSVSKKMHIRYLCAFEKLTFTRQQTQLSQKERRLEPKNSFRLKTSAQKIIQNKHIVIVDDVVTTGSTSSELAKLLKLAGVSRVDVWCIART